jgi:hypothetical protein
MAVTFPDIAVLNSATWSTIKILKSVAERLQEADHQVTN